MSCGVLPYFHALIHSHSHSHSHACRWTIKIFPFCSSELLYDALQLAIAAREVDMRASPYDLTSYRPPPEPHSDLRSCDCDYSSQSNATHSVGLGGLGLGMSSEPIRVELPEVSAVQR